MSPNEPWRNRDRLGAPDRQRATSLRWGAARAQRLTAWLRSRYEDAAEVQRLPAGLTSVAFAFRHAGAEFVIRISASEAGFRKDAVAARAFGGPALPVPAVLEVGRLDDGRAFCVSRRATGRRLRELTLGEADAAAGAVAATIAAIAAAPLAGRAGFGPFDAAGVGQHPTWRAFLRAVPDGEWGRADMPLIARMREAVEAGIDGCPEARALVHGDFGSANVLCAGDRVTAVIDWALALYGDPVYEWAGVAFWDEPRLRPVLARLAAGPGVADRLRCYQLRIGLQEIHAAAVDGNPVDLDWLQGRCRQLLEA